MPRKQRFKPTRKPQLTNEGALERSQEQHQTGPASEESVLSQGNEDHDSKRRSE